MHHDIPNRVPMSHGSNPQLSTLLAPLGRGPARAPLARAAVVSLFALLFRVAFVLDFSSQPLFDANLAQGTDMQVLIGWARRIADGDLLGRGNGPFWWAPLFPYTLGGVFALLGSGNLRAAALAQAALGALTCGLLYLLGRRCLDETTALIGGLLAAAYGTAVFYTGIFLSTTLEVFLAVAILLGITAARARPTVPRWLAAGIVTGLGCLARPNFLLPALLLGALLPLLIRRPGGGPNWATIGRAGAAFACGVILAIAPVTVRNWTVGGQLVLVSAAGPETFRIANSYDSTPLNFVYPRQPVMPITAGAFWRHQIRKAVLFWWGFEAPQNVNIYLARTLSPTLRLAWVPFWLAVPLAVVGLWATRSQANALAHVYIFLGGYYLAVVPFFVIARWRLPLIVPLLLFSAAGLLALCRWIAAKQWRAAALGVAVSAALALLIRPVSGPFIFAADHGQLGYLLANRGDFAEAASHLARAVADQPQNAVLQRDLGLFLYRLGRGGEARTHLETAVALAPTDPLCHLYLGRLILASGGDPAQASAHLRRVLTLDPHGPAATTADALLKSLDPEGRMR